MNFLPKLATSGRPPKKISSVLSDFSVGGAATPCRSNKRVVQKTDSCHWANGAQHRRDGASLVGRCFDYCRICHDYLPSFDRAYCPVMVTSLAKPSPLCCFVKDCAGIALKETRRSGLHQAPQNLAKSGVLAAIMVHEFVPEHQ